MIEPPKHRPNMPPNEAAKYPVRIGKNSVIFSCTNQSIPGEIKAASVLNTNYVSKTKSQIMHFGKFIIGYVPEKIEIFACCFMGFDYFLFLLFWTPIWRRFVLIVSYIFQPIFLK